MVGVLWFVNVVCDGVLLVGYAKVVESVGSGIVWEVANDLGLTGEEGEFEVKAEDRF